MGYCLSWGIIFNSFMSCFVYILKRFVSESTFQQKLQILYFSFVTFIKWLFFQFYNFHEVMFSKLSGCPYISLSFDETSNGSVQKSQMGIIIWFWGSESNFVATRFLGSEFMGRSTAEDVSQTFLAGISDLDQSKILLQVALDGPNVNLLFLKNLADSREEKNCYLSWYW